MSSDAEQAAYVQRLLDGQAAQLAAFQASTQAAIDNLRQSWSEGYEQQLADHRAWLKSLYGDTSEGTTQDVGQGHGASATGPAPAPGPGPGQPSPYEIELQRAQTIRDMPMSEYAARRGELGVHPSTSMDRLFGETR
jgi:hypothetical protein